MKILVVLTGLLFSMICFSEEFPSDTLAAQALITETEPRAQFNYCITGTLTCRKLVLLKNKANETPRLDFYDVFLSAERAVGSTGYFPKNADGTFRAILDDVFDGQILITKKFAQNQNLTVTFDTDGYPTIHDLSLVRVGTSKYILATMSYNEAQASIIGTEFDSANPNHRVPVQIIYDRIN